ncbi:MAG: hypothetical protein QXH38_03365 [Candidatus Bathyarchaeia archaeon]
MEREGKAGSYIARFKKVLNSWLAFNGINVIRLMLGASLMRRLSLMNVSQIGRSLTGYFGWLHLGPGSQSPL